MSDFMLWLHANYIRPQMEAPARGSDYALRLELLQCQLADCGLEDLDKTLEFTAIQAFLLGLRTGEGLARQIPPSGPPETRTPAPEAALSRR